LFGYATLNELSHHCCFSVLNIKQDVYQAAQVLTESRFNIVDMDVYFPPSVRAVCCAYENVVFW
jgi:hypothetical protein